MDSSIDRCWRCGCAGELKTVDVGRGADYQVVCSGCGSVGLVLYTEKQAIDVWNDGQRKYRTGLSDTQLLEKGKRLTDAGAGETLPITAPTDDKLRE